MSLEQSICGVPDRHLLSAAHHPQPAVFTHVASTLILVHIGQQELVETKDSAAGGSLFATQISPQYAQTDSTVHAPQLSKLAQYWEVVNAESRIWYGSESEADPRSASLKLMVAAVAFHEPTLIPFAAGMVYSVMLIVSVKPEVGIGPITPPSVQHFIHCHVADPVPVLNSMRALHRHPQGPRQVALQGR